MASDDFWPKLHMPGLINIEHRPGGDTAKYHFEDPFVTFEFSRKGDELDDDFNFKSYSSSHHGSFELQDTTEASIRYVIEKYIKYINDRARKIFIEDENAGAPPEWKPDTTHFNRAGNWSITYQYKDTPLKVRLSELDSIMGYVDYNHRAGRGLGGTTAALVESTGYPKGHRTVIYQFRYIKDELATAMRRSTGSFVPLPEIVPMKDDPLIPSWREVEHYIGKGFLKQYID